MANALLSIRTDNETKKEITQFASSLGLSVSAFVTTALRQTMQEGKLVLTPSFKPTPYLEKIIKKAEEDLKAGLASKPMNKKEVKQHLEALMKK
jgi:addiction module RelB/DinJ family antitoxin